MKTPISVYIVTLNEAEHIAETLDSVRDLDEIIVIDSGSNDGTVEIARERGAKVVHQEWLGFSKQKAFGLSQCKNEWCMNLDGDEVLPAPMLREIQSLVDSDTCDVIRFRIEDLFMGAPMHPGSRKRRIARCFRKSRVRYPTDRSVHENIETSGRVVTTREAMIHYGYDDVRLFMDKYSGYAALKAMDKYAQGKQASTFKLLLVFPLSFLKVYFLRGMVLSGRRGLIQAYVESMYAFLKEANLYQRQRTGKREKR